MMDLHDHLRLMARYKLWAYRRLFAEVDDLTDADYRADCQLFFASNHGTLNHLLLVERLWEARLQGATSRWSSLDQEVCSDRRALREAVLASSEGWVEHCSWRPDTVGDETALASDLHYRNLKGEPLALPRPMIALHVFNHASHHRGQISAALTRLG